MVTYHYYCARITLKKKDLDIPPIPVLRLFSIVLCVQISTVLNPLIFLVQKGKQQINQQTFTIGTRSLQCLLWALDNREIQWFVLQYCCIFQLPQFLFTANQKINAPFSYDQLETSKPT